MRKDVITKPPVVYSTRIYILGMKAQTCSANTWELRQAGPRLKANLGYTSLPCLKTKQSSLVSGCFLTASRCFDRRPKSYGRYRKIVHAVK